jgi:DMSO/TMAO reductase YedYZ molybdopterin-dependent catalytic subunit
LLRSTWIATGAAVLLSAGESIPWLRRISVFEVRSGKGPGGIPVNHSAKARGVVAEALSPDYRLRVRHDGRSVELSIEELAALPQHTYDLPIACVEGWSASGSWTGVRVRDLLDLVGAPSGVDVEVQSLQASGGYRLTTLPANFADNHSTLLALQLNGEPLSIDHGYPCRLIAPDRPGVLQTKWVGSLEV